MGDKIFKTHEELLSLLSDRGVKMDTKELRTFAKKRLQHEGYYNLINGYKKLFLMPNETDKFKEGTTVNEIYALFTFDQKLREIFLRTILPVERNIKCIIAYTFPQKYSHDNYLLYNNFDTSRNDANVKITSLLSEIQRQISSRGLDPSIRHYLNNYGYIPLWVLNNILSFGNISKFYYNMKQSDRQSVSKVFRLMDNELATCLKYLTDIRNCCAHSNRLYCFRAERKVLFDTKFHLGLSINKENEYIQGKRDLFAAVIILKMLISNAELNTMIKDISNCMKELESRLSVLSMEEILNEMGFPDNWKQIKNIPK